MDSKTVYVENIQQDSVNIEINSQPSYTISSPLESVQQHLINNCCETTDFGKKCTFQIKLQILNYVR